MGGYIDKKFKMYRYLADPTRRKHWIKNYKRKTDPQVSHHNFVR